MEDHGACRQVTQSLLPLGCQDRDEPRKDEAQIEVDQNFPQNALVTFQRRAVQGDHLEAENPLSRCSTLLPVVVDEVAVDTTEIGQKKHQRQKQHGDRSQKTVAGKGGVLIDQQNRQHS